MSIGDRISSGPFRFSFGFDEPAEYINHRGRAVVLEGSEYLSGLIDLDNGSALGYDGIWQCYLPEFQEAGWLRRESRSQMGIWDLQTGARTLSLNGMHLGEVKGAEILDETRLLTWGRDYLARTWDLHTGELNEVFPLPLGRSDSNGALISCRDFTSLSTTERAWFISERHLPSPDVQLYTMVMPGSAQLDYGLFSGVRPAPNASVTLHPPFDEILAPNWINDMQNAEAGYSTTHTLRDGRRVTGGTTYGASGIVYVWDGLFDLTLLFPSKAQECFSIMEEVQPNVLEMGEWVEHYEIGPLYRWVV